VQQFINENPPPFWVRGQIYAAFHLGGRRKMPSPLPEALARVELSTGQNYDFWSLNHRINLGITLIDHARGKWQQ
jgi:hypothetical protein